VLRDAGTLSAGPEEDYRSTDHEDERDGTGAGAEDAGDAGRSCDAENGDDSAGRAEAQESEAGQARTGETGCFC
jgi:hypothetical protein